MFVTGENVTEKPDCKLPCLEIFWEANYVTIRLKDLTSSFCLVCSSVFRMYLFVAILYTELTAQQKYKVSAENRREDIQVDIMADSAHHTRASQ